MNAPLNWIDDLTALLPPGRVVTAEADVDRLSKDFYWYSPVLERQLRDKRGDVAAQPRSVDEVRQILSFAARRGVPLTVRGAATGNYGQCIPLEGGILLDLAALDRVVDISADGIATCEPGARLAVIESTARKAGWELRCYPSTYQKASVGGFLAGGSGGIGSISHGVLRDNQTVRWIQLLTMEPEPREILLEGRDVLKALHAWGTNGVFVEVGLTLAPRTDWAQLAVAFPTFDACLDFTEDVAITGTWRKRLVSCFEWPIPGWFAPLQKWVPQGEALAFFEIADPQLEELSAAASAAGGRPVFSSPHQEPRRGAQLSDYTWNHTTLWAKKAEPSLTYLQCGFDPQTFRDQIARLKARFGDELLCHFEFLKADGVIVPGCLPIVRFTTEERLQEMIDFCGTIGVTIANPHINHLEGSGRWRPDDAKLVAKHEFDPMGLMNPGKMIGFKPTAAPQPAAA